MSTKNEQKMNEKVILPRPRRIYFVNGKLQIYIESEGKCNFCIVVIAQNQKPFEKPKCSKKLKIVKSEKIY